jgi:hypothetical protein
VTSARRARSPHGSTTDMKLSILNHDNLLLIVELGVAVLIRVRVKVLDDVLALRL